MLNLVTKVQHQNSKNQTVILIFPINPTYILICCVLHLKNDDTVPNAPKIKKILKVLVAQNCVNGTTIYSLNKIKTCLLI